MAIGRKRRHKIIKINKMSQKKVVQELDRLEESGQKGSRHADNLRTRMKNLFWNRFEERDKEGSWH